MRGNVSSVLSLLDLKWVCVFCGRKVLAALLHDLDRSHLCDCRTANRAYRDCVGFGSEVPQRCPSSDACDDWDGCYQKQSRFAHCYLRIENAFHCGMILSVTASRLVWRDARSFSSRVHGVNQPDVPLYAVDKCVAQHENLLQAKNYLRWALVQSSDPSVLGPKYSCRVTGQRSNICAKVLGPSSRPARSGEEAAIVIRGSVCGMTAFGPTRPFGVLNIATAFGGRADASIALRSLSNSARCAW